MTARPDTTGIERQADGFQVDARLVADGLGVETSWVPALLRSGEITSVCERGVEPYLRSAVLAYSLFGSFALGQEIRAERRSAHDRAGHLYALSLVNHFVAYASIMAHRLLEAPGGS